MNYYLTEAGKEFKAEVAGVPFSQVKAILRSPSKSGQAARQQVTKVRKAEVISRRKAGDIGDINLAQVSSPEVKATKQRAAEVGRRLAHRQMRYGTRRHGEAGAESIRRFDTSYQRYKKNYRETPTEG